ncbi:MAG: PAS domain-containing sensor histidine kinase [Anaerolineales bacterium]
MGCPFPPKPERLLPPCDRGNYEKLFEVLPYGVLRFDVQGVVREANPAAARILGLSIYELQGRTLDDRDWQVTDTAGELLPPEQYPLAQAIRSGKPVRDYLVSVFSPVQRRHVWIRGDVIPQRMIEDGPMEYWVIFLDFTEEYEANAALRESRSNLDLAQRVASVGSCVYNYRQRRWSWSSEMMQLYGITEQEALLAGPDAFSALVDVQDREAYLHGLEIGSLGTVPYPLEFTLVLGSQDRRIIYREAELVEGNNGISGIIFTHKDITEAREAERQKETLQYQLYHAQRLEAVGTLASGIAHDLNNTLVPIIGLTQSMLAMPNTDPQIRPLLELVEQAGGRARELVRQVVAFSRKEIPAKTIFDLSSVIEKSMKLARAGIPSAINLCEKISPVGLFEGNATQIHQLLVNLISNASQAIGEQKGTITVCLRSSAHDPSMVELEVCDTGVGIDTETQKHIFEPFFTTKGVGAGTGLGLSVVHGIVHSHGGTIEVKSTPGRGTSFLISLPKCRSCDETRACN